MADFLMQSRDNPMKALGLAFSIITVMVLVTVMISTIIYFRNTKSNRITPARRIIRRRQKSRASWTLRPRFGRSDQSFGKFFPDDDTSDSPQSPSRRPHRAPALPPPAFRFTPGRASGCGQCPRYPAPWPPETPAGGPAKAQTLSRDLPNNDGGGISSALVSELK